MSAKRYTKADIAERLYQKVQGFSRKQASAAVNLVFELMKETLERGETIKISGYGNFLVRDKSARWGRHPRTGEQMALSERRVITFKPSLTLRVPLKGSSVSVPEKSDSQCEYISW